MPGVLQRGCSIHASKVDVEEAYCVGQKAVQIAIEDGTGYMATTLRKKQDTYEAYFDKVKLDVVANSERFLPDSWIAPSGIDVTDDFVKYAQPLIQGGWPDIKIENGLQRFARLDVKFVEKKLHDYKPQAF
jgi:6-phosphofructokinase 1